MHLLALRRLVLAGLPGLFLATAPLRAQEPGTQRFTASINGAQIAYTVTGAANTNGQTLVLIHGYPLNGDLFAAQRRVLGASHRVITVDLRGFGRNVAPDEQGSVDLYANDVLALLDQLNIPQAIIGGHSLGGAITLRLYQLAPNRFRGMILNDAASQPPPIAEQFMWRGYQQQSLLQGVNSLVPLLIPEFLTGATRTTRPNFVNKVEALILAASPNGLIGGARALETRPDLRAVFGNIAVPTLILEGQEDSLTPLEQAIAINRSIPGSTLAVIPGASHGVIREAAGASNAAILNWLGQNFR